MKKHAFIVLTLGILFILLSAGTVSATIKKPSYSVGDYWEYYSEIRYNYLENDTLIMVETEEVRTEITDINDANNTITMKETIDTIVYNDTGIIIGNAVTTSTYYLRQSDLAIKKVSQKTTGGNQSEIEYLIPYKQLEYPLNVGDTGNFTTAFQVDDEDVELTVKYDVFKKEEVELGEVNGKENVTYNCHVVEINETTTGIMTYMYFAPNIGRYVYLEEYSYENFGTTEEPINVMKEGYRELTKYSYAAAPKESGDTPGFQAAFFFIAITTILLLVWVQRRKQ